MLVGKHGWTNGAWGVAQEAERYRAEAAALQQQLDQLSVSAAAVPAVRSAAGGSLAAQVLPLASRLYAFRNRCCARSLRSVRVLVISGEAPAGGGAACSR